MVLIKPSNTSICATKKLNDGNSAPGNLIKILEKSWNFVIVEK